MSAAVETAIAYHQGKTGNELCTVDPGDVAGSAAIGGAFSCFGSLLLTTNNKFMSIMNASNSEMINIYCRPAVGTI